MTTLFKSHSKIAKVTFVVTGFILLEKGEEVRNETFNAPITLSLTEKGTVGFILTIDGVQQRVKFMLTEDNNVYQCHDKKFIHGTKVYELNLKVKTTLETE